MIRFRLLQLAAIGRDLRRQLTSLYCITAFAAGVVPLASGATLARSGSGSAESRRRRYFGELRSQLSAPREPEVFRPAPPPLDRYRATRTRIRARDRRRLSAIASLVPRAAVFAIAWSVLPAVTAGALSVGGFAFFVAVIQVGRLATTATRSRPTWHGRWG